MKPIVVPVLVGLLFFQSCSPIPPGFVKKQQIKYIRTDVTRISSDEVSANIVFQDINRDSTSLDNVSVAYQLFMEGQKVATGQDIRFNFKANDTTEFVIPVTVRYLDAFKTAENLTKAVLKGRKTARFQMNAVITLDYKVASFSIAVSAEGELPLPEAKKPNIKL